MKSSRRFPSPCKPSARRSSGNLVLKLAPIDDAPGLLGDAAIGVHAGAGRARFAAHRDVAAAGDAGKAAGAAGDLVVAVAADHLEPGAGQLAIDLGAVLAGDGAAGAPGLPLVGEVEGEDGRADQVAGQLRALVGHDVHGAGEGAEESALPDTGRVGAALALPDRKGGDLGLLGGARGLPQAGG